MAKADKGLFPRFNRPELDAYVEFLATLISDRNAVYVSTPITTGLRFVEWYEIKGAGLVNRYGPHSDEYSNAHRANVIIPNIEEGRAAVRIARKQLGPIVLDPTQLDLPTWTQEEYRYLWGRIIELYVEKVLMVEGWQFSDGCVYEFLSATKHNLTILNQDLQHINHLQALDMLKTAISRYKRCNTPTDLLETAHDELVMLLDIEAPRQRRDVIQQRQNLLSSNSRRYEKDAILDSLAQDSNIAQFVSFSPDLQVRYVRIRGISRDERFSSEASAIETLLARSQSNTVNIRVFDLDPDRRGNLHWELSAEKAIDLVRMEANDGYYTIVNETIDIEDGGVSGVAYGDVLNFAPSSTPRCVEDPDVCSLDRSQGMRLLEVVYGFRPAIDFNPDIRVEFSIHPIRHGLRKRHTIIWELIQIDNPSSEVVLEWPNRFSRFLGDKLFGLLVANDHGFLVPATIAATRQAGIFTFGQHTSMHEQWTRPAPENPEPGHYTTHNRYVSPFQMVDQCNKEFSILKESSMIGGIEHSKVSQVMSILYQDSIEAEFSGAAELDFDGTLTVEGIAGFGNKYMSGEKDKEQIPRNVKVDVEAILKKAGKAIGPVRVEWVHDGRLCWIVQLQKKESTNIHSANCIVEGHYDQAIEVHLPDHLSKEEKDSIFFDAVNKANNNPGTGIELFANVGLLCHYCDKLIREGIPSRLHRYLE